MEVVHILIGVIVLLIGLKVIKYLLFKRTAKFFTTVLVLLVTFLFFCYAFKDVGHFQGNKFVQTGAVIAGGVMNIFKENVDTDALVNSTLKSNKLFKSQKSL